MPSQAQAREESEGRRRAVEEADWGLREIGVSVINAWKTSGLGRGGKD